jgi:chromate reductase, NAD(P)H dehydrogenase (quinone)
MNDAFTVFGFVGSLRRASFNWMLMRRAEALSPEGVSFDVYPDLGLLPHFSQEIEGEKTPADVLDFRARIERADAVLVATPEYNSSMPGVLKNALDWASRPPGESVLDGKPAATLGASPGRFGSARAQADVRKVMTSIGAVVAEKEFAVPRAHEVFDPEGRVVDEETEPRLVAHLDAMFTPAPRAKSETEEEMAEYSLACQRLAAAGSD